MAVRRAVVRCIRWNGQMKALRPGTPIRRCNPKVTHPTCKSADQGNGKKGEVTDKEWASESSPPGVSRSERRNQFAVTKKESTQFYENHHHTRHHSSLRHYSGRGRSHHQRRGCSIGQSALQSHGNNRACRDALSEVQVRVRDSERCRLQRNGPDRNHCGPTCVPGLRNAMGQERPWKRQSGLRGPHLLKVQGLIGQRLAEIN